MNAVPDAALWVAFTGGALVATSVWCFVLLAVRWRDRASRPPPRPSHAPTRPLGTIRPPPPEDTPPTVVAVPQPGRPPADSLYFPASRTWSEGADTVPQPVKPPPHLVGKTASLTPEDLEEAEAELRRVRESTWPKATRVPAEFRTRKDPK